MTQSAILPTSSENLSPKPPPGSSTTPPSQSVPSTATTPPSPQPTKNDDADRILDIPGIGQMVITRHQNNAQDLLTVDQTLDNILADLAKRINR